MAPTTPKQSGPTTGKQVLADAKYTGDVIGSIYKNLMTTQQGTARQATAAQDQTLSAMARFAASSQGKSNHLIQRASARQKNIFGAAMGGVVSQKMQAAKVEARGQAMVNQGEINAASDLKAGNSMAFDAYKAAAQTSYAAAQTQLAEQMKMYNNAVSGAAGDAKAIIASAAQDGEIVNRLWHANGAMDRGAFYQALVGQGLTGPEADLMWKSYGNMQQGQDAGAAFRSAASLIYGDKVAKGFLDTIPNGVLMGINGRAGGVLNQLADQGMSADQIRAQLTKDGVPQHTIDILMAQAEAANPGWTASAGGGGGGTGALSGGVTIAGGGGRTQGAAAAVGY
jgi:hypothetical protein